MAPVEITHTPHKSFTVSRHPERNGTEPEGENPDTAVSVSAQHKLPGWPH